MAALGLVALGFLILFGYSAGSVLSRRGTPGSPGGLDLALVTGLWLGAGWARDTFGVVWSVLVWFPIAAVLGSAAAWHRPQSGRPLTVTGSGWRLRDVGNFQSRLLMAYFYILVVMPVGLAVGLFTDVLDIRTPPPRTNWRARAVPDRTIDEARRQF